MNIEPKKAKIVNPAPYFKIEFGCSNRAFYGVKSDLCKIGEEIDIEVYDGYITEECDYDGDLERIIIYSGERNEKLRDSVLDFYGVAKSEVPEDHNIVLSIF